MARTVVAAQVLPTGFAAAGLVVTESAGDAVNGNATPSTGQEYIYARNTDSAGHTLTVQGAGDPQGRTANSVTALAAGAVAVTQRLPSNPAGWQQADGTIWFNVDSALVKVAVLRIPQGG